MVALPIFFIESRAIADNFYPFPMKLIFVLFDSVVFPISCRPLHPVYTTNDYHIWHFGQLLFSANVSNEHVGATYSST